MSIVTDPADPRLHQVRADGQNEAYLVLPEDQRKDTLLPYRDSYIHRSCGAETKMGRELSETYQAKPHFYGSTYCVGCKAHFPVDEFKWSADGYPVGSHIVPIPKK